MKAYSYEYLRCEECRSLLMHHTNRIEGGYYITVSCPYEKCSHYKVHYDPPRIELTKSVRIPDGP